MIRPVIRDVGRPIGSAIGVPFGISKTVSDHPAYCIEYQLSWAKTTDPSNDIKDYQNTMVEALLLVVIGQEWINY